MVFEFSPDPPDEDAQEIKPVPFLQNEQFGDSNTDSEDENDFEYDGYEPIPMGPDIDGDVDESEGEDSATASNIPNPNFPNLPSIASVDEEILREVWSSPSETSIPMDAAKEDQIRSAMANFTLPSTSIPDWATSIPDEDFKKQLNEWIKQQKIH